MGYGHFPQEDHRTNSVNHKDDILLLQIDSEGDIMWGDGGTAYVFIDPLSLENGEFDKAYFFSTSY